MIYSYSQFNYGHEVTTDNQTIVFGEGGPKLYAEIEPGGYSLADFVQAVADALNGAGTLGYTVTVNRSLGNLITIQAASAFSLYFDDAGMTAGKLLGNYATITLSGQSSYTGRYTSGSIYRPQFMVQSYTPSANYAESLESTVNQAASGRVELVRFGVIRKIEVELRFISNLPMDNRVIRTNPTGVQDTLNFLDYGTTKAPFEWVPDVNNPNVFETVFLDSTPDSKDGTGYKLKELLADNVPDVYETGVLTLQVV